MMYSIVRRVNPIFEFWDNSNFGNLVYKYSKNNSDVSVSHQPFWWDLINIYRYLGESLLVTYNGLWNGAPFSTCDDITTPPEDKYFIYVKMTTKCLLSSRFRAGNPVNI